MVGLERDVHADAALAGEGEGRRTADLAAACGLAGNVAQAQLRAVERAAGRNMAERHAGGGTLQAGVLPRARCR